jgi:hypothetical protein
MHVLQCACLGHNEIQDQVLKDKGLMGFSIVGGLQHWAIMKIKCANV